MLNHALPASPTPLASWKTRLLVLVYGMTAAVFVWMLSGFYLPGKGFTALLCLGDRNAVRALPQLLAEKPYIEPQSDGYDGQFYVQLALQPNLHDPALQQALDSPAYRARRILLPWTAWCLGGGAPGRVMHVYSALNLACWLALGALLLRWFPATGWNNYFRWAGVLLSFGLCFSVRASLLDGPSLLAIAVGIALLESGRPWWASAVLGAAGLIRETNILSAAVFIPTARKPKLSQGLTFLRLATVLLPCLLWVLYLRIVFGPGGGGDGNFDLPFRAFALKWQATLSELFQRGLGLPNDRSLLLLLSLTVQSAVLLLRPQPSHPWWRLGAAYFVLMAFLGPAVWEGYPGAAARTLLPMALAFNILLPHGKRWLPILLLGNATVFCFFSSFQYPSGNDHVFTGQPVPGPAASAWKVTFSDEWYPPSRSHWEYWRWSRDSAHFTLTNPLPTAASANITFQIKSRDARTVTLRQGDQTVWQGQVSARLQSVRMESLSLPPGDQTWFIYVSESQNTPPPAARQEGVCLRNLRIDLLPQAPRTTSAP